MHPPEETIVFDNVSKFYGDVLGVNRINLVLPPGITGLVGPNGAGKSTLMNLTTGLLRPTEGEVRVLGRSTSDAQLIFDKVGYLTQFDTFPSHLSGYQFVYSYLRVHGLTHAEADRLTIKAIDRVSLRDAAQRKIGGYSKGMRQRIRLAQAIAHEPRILVLDEPLNGLDPLARSEVIGVFKSFAEEGNHVIISSHILHEVDMISDQVVLLSGGYVVAEGEVHGVRTEIQEHPIQVLVRCSRIYEVAAKLFEKQVVAEITVTDDKKGLLVRTRDANGFYSYFNQLVLDLALEVEMITVADSDVRSVYAYLIEQGGESA